MKTNLNKIITNKYILWGLGFYQVFAGIFGFYLVFQQSFMYIFRNFLFFTIILGLFFLSIISGFYLLKKEKKIGINLSLLNQILQLLQFKILGFGFYYVAGCYLGIGFTDTPEIKFLFKDSLFRSSCFISFKTSDYEISIILNIVALALVIFLSKLKNLNLKTADKE
ncbi:MAG: hypothetical protein V1733_05485 [bacterium]